MKQLHYKAQMLSMHVCSCHNIEFIIIYCMIINNLCISNSQAMLRLC